MKKRIVEITSKQSLLLLFLALTVVFTVSYKTIFNVHYTDLQGAHSWLSASTIKFVNNWLEDGPCKLSFVNYESPSSIEFNHVTERKPYISYPSGCTLFVYVFARLFGRTAIDISFLKHFQMICFWIEVLLFGLFVYRFLERNNIKTKWEKIIASFATASLWFCLPTNVWYLANIYFADQCITLFVMAYLLVEYESLFSTKQSERNLLNSIRALLTFCGVLIDYYFWVIVFVAFILEIACSIKRKLIAHVACSMLWYGIPFLLAIAFHLYQLLSIPNWFDTISQTFLVRSGAELTSTGTGSINTLSTIIHYIYGNFKFAFGLLEVKRIVLLLLVIMYLIFQYHKLEPSKKIKRYVKSTIVQKNIFVLLIGFISPILQVILLKNHSAIHEFSMIKFAWCFAIIPVVCSVIFCHLFEFPNGSFKFGKISFSPFFHGFIISFLVIVIITNVPFSSRDFRTIRMLEHHDYHLANVLQENTSYEHVCFSFTDEIKYNPPQELSVSKKRVYKINKLSDIETMFPNLSSRAIKILVINRKRTKGLSDIQKRQEMELLLLNNIIFNDANYTLVQIE